MNVEICKRNKSLHRILVSLNQAKTCEVDTCVYTAEVSHIVSHVKTTAISRTVFFIHERVDFRKPCE